MAAPAQQRSQVISRSEHPRDKPKQSKAIGRARQGGGRAMDLPAKLFDVARPGVAQQLQNNLQLFLRVCMAGCRSKELLSRPLESASTGYVHLPRVQTSIGQRSFAFFGPQCRSVCRLHCLSLRHAFGQPLKCYLQQRSVLTFFNSDEHLLTTPSTPPFQAPLWRFCFSGIIYECHLLT